MTQGTIDYERVGTNRPLARSTDKLTSHVAAERARKSGLVRSHSDKIMAVLEAHRGFPMTAHEIGAECGLNNVQVLRRMAGLVGDGMAAECTEPRTCSKTGKKLTAFVVM